MKTLKKLFAIAMVLTMLFAFAAPAMAVVTIDGVDYYQITITNADNISSAGHEYSAYQLFSGKLDSTGTILTEIQWGDGISNPANFLLALKADPTIGTLFASATTAANVATVLATPANQTEAVLDAFSKIATDFRGTITASSTAADSPYVINIPVSKSGYYLVYDDPTVLAGQQNKDVSDYILQVVADTSVEHKGSIPTMDKQVSETGESYGDAIPVGIGDVHYYRIKAELPDDYFLYEDYYLQFVDNMTSGLTFLEIVEVKALIRSGSGSSYVIDDSCYTVLPTASVDGPMTLTVTFDDTKGKGLKQAKTDVGGVLTPITLTADDAVEVIYKATVNTDAIVDGNGIPNQAKIIYSNDPNTSGHGESKPDETNVYPVNLEIIKVDGQDKAIKLPGAKFLLIREYNKGLSVHDEYAVVDGSGKLSDWTHHYNGDGCAADNAEHNAATLATILVTDANGKINVSGLDAGKFKLTEIAPPDGYNKLTDTITLSFHITIDEVNDKINGMSGTTSAGIVEYDANDATVHLTIDNYKGNVLPSTGGIGTTIFYIFGGVLAVAAVVLLITKKRMAAED